MRSKEIRTRQTALIGLASSSSQRASIMKELGLSFRILPVCVDEVVEKMTAATVAENAKRKLIAGLASAANEMIVKGSDTVLAVRASVLGKPRTEAEAIRYLRMQRGRRVDAHTGIAVARKGASVGVLARQVTALKMRDLTDAEIAWYVKTGEPLDQAGAIGINRYGELLLDRIEGDYSCLAGLPKAALLLALIRVTAATPDALLPRPPVSILARARVSVRTLIMNNTGSFHTAECGQSRRES